MDKWLIFHALSTKTAFLWTVCQLCRLVHQIVTPVDKQLIFGVLSTKTASRWTNSLSSGPCPPKRPHGGQTAYLRSLVHENGLTVDKQLCGRGCFILPEHLFLVWLWQQISVPKVPLCLIRTKKTSRVRYNLTRFADSKRTAVFSLAFCPHFATPVTHRITMRQTIIAHSLAKRMPRQQTGQGQPPNNGQPFRSQQR